MSVDLSDPAILPAYQEIISGGSRRWLLLKYSTRDKLFLTTSGTGTIDELKSLIIRDEIQFGLFRVDELDHPDPRCALLSYVPIGTSGVLRARAMVHGRTVASLFHKAYNSMLSFSDVSQINFSAILKQIEFEVVPRESFDHQIAFSGRARSTSASSIDRKLPDLPISKITIGQQTVADSFDAQNDPPPTPPKAYFQNRRGPVAETRRTVSEAMPRPNPQQAHDRNVSSPNSTAAKSAPRVSAPPVIHRIHRRGPSLEHDPDYNVRMRMELQKSREKAEQEIQEAEEEANSFPKIVEKQEEYDLIEEERKKLAEKERQSRIAARLRREEAKRRQEEEEDRIREMRKAENQARKAEAARMAFEKRVKTLQEIEQAKKQESERVRMRRAASKANLLRVKKEYGLTEDAVKEGFIYIQPSDSVTWKRRYFEASKDEMKFYRDEKKTKMLESLNVGGASVKEWDDGFDDLRVIPHSFALSFDDGRESWSFYTDTLDEKNIVVGLISKV